MEVKLSFVGLVLVWCLLLGFLGEGRASSDGKVAVDFYSESLCPYCSNFIVNYLSKIVDNGVIDIVDLRMIPYGNAHVYPTGEIICQHGEDECKLNIIQTCAIKLWPKVTKWFPFILCLETLVEDLPRAEVYPKWKTCVEPAGLSLELLEKCFGGPLGDTLEREFAAETDSLIPPHQYVPWVLVNGTPLYDDYVYIEKSVCQAYKGANTPNVCERYSGAGNAMIESVLEKEGSVRGVCERD
jgi:interferon gamma-inducible protein 30